MPKLADGRHLHTNDYIKRAKYRYLYFLVKGNSSRKLSLTILDYKGLKLVIATAVKTFLCINYSIKFICTIVNIVTLILSNSRKFNLVEGINLSKHCQYVITQETNTCPKSTIETLEKGVKYVQS